MAAVIVIPARMSSTRLPGKPLADIGGEPMIVHVWRRAVAAASGPVLVAVAEAEIAAAITRAGGEAVLTAPDLPSGSDRVQAALARFDPDRRFDQVVNLQGDLPALDPAAIATVLRVLAESGADIATLVAPITDPAERDDPNCVKAVVSFPPEARSGRALWFTRLAAPGGDGPLWHHIGIYGYRRAALERFVGLAPAPLEQRERLEQLRALEAGMTIAAARVDSVPLGVDTPADLARIRRMLVGPGAAHQDDPAP